MLRQKLTLFLVVTVVFLGSALMIYGQRTGKLTIFGDVPMITGKAEITDKIDLEKGVKAGDGNLVVKDNELLLKDGSILGTAQFDIGHPQITQFLRFQSVKKQDWKTGRISIRFAGSLDGVAFGNLSPTYDLNKETTNQDTIDLTKIIGEDEHFVRAVVMIEAKNDNPTLAGFAIDYNSISQVVAESSNQPPIFINGSLKGSNMGVLSQNTPKPANFIATGGDWIINSLIALWILSMIVIGSERPKNKFIVRR